LTARARRYPGRRGRRRGAAAWVGAVGIVVFAADHQLPGDARGLVGERHRGELGRLAGKEGEEPRRGPVAPAPCLLDDRGGADHHQAAQGLVAGAGDGAEPLPVRGGMVLRRQPHPRREISTTAKSVRIGDLDRQGTGTDRADRGYRGEPPAQLVVAMPGHQLGLDLAQPCQQLGIFPAVQREQLLGRLRQRRIVGDARQQRIDLVEPPGGDQRNSAA
jgi:hypothetical protein